MYLLNVLDYKSNQLSIGLIRKFIIKVPWNRPQSEPLGMFTKVYHRVARGDAPGRLGGNCS